MSQRAWTLPPASVVFALLACMVLPTQILFQRQLFLEWSTAGIAAAWLGQFMEMLLTASVMWVAVALAGRLPIRRRPLKLACFGIVLVAGACAGEWVALWWHWQSWPNAGLAAILPRALRWVPIGALGSAILVARQRTRDLEARLHDSQMEQLRFERQQAAWNLQALQAQIEPHFLFNTLATIRRLQHTDPERGRSTLAGFIHYLKASLPGMRQVEVSLGQETDLVRGYLEVLQVRMGERLAFVVDVDSRLREQRVPPLSVATLVENAVKHGLASLPEGGTITVRAWLDGGACHIDVADTGTGLTANSGSGTGLANLRQRLTGLYGQAGGLSLAANEPRGLVVRLRVPAGRQDAGEHSHAA